MIHDKLKCFGVLMTDYSYVSEIKHWAIKNGFLMSWNPGVYLGINDDGEFKWMHEDECTNIITMDEFRELAGFSDPEVTQGKKFDDGKLRMSLVPHKALQERLKVLEHGAKKYGEHNWRKVGDAKTRYYDAAHRHLAAYFSGEAIDPESGFSHLAHAACSIDFLLELELGAASGGDGV